MAIRETDGSSRVTPHSTEAFIIRVFRQKNNKAFLKAFTDEPEQLTVGFSPLKDVMKELQLRNVHIYPRYVLVAENIRYVRDIYVPKLPKGSTKMYANHLNGAKAT